MNKFSEVGSLLGCLLLPTLLLGRFETTGVLGSVKDPAGGGDPQASVTLIKQGTETEVRRNSGASRNFNFFNVKADRFTITIGNTGFAKATSKDVAVNVITRQRVDFALQLGAISIAVMATGATAALQTDSSQHGRVVHTQQKVTDRESVAVTPRVTPSRQDDLVMFSEFARQIAENPKSAQPYLMRGQLLFDRGRTAEAIEDLSRAIENDPALAAAYLYRALCYWRFREFDHVLGDLDKAVELEPSSSFNLAKRGRARRVLKDYTAALADLNRAIELNPREASAYLDRAYTYAAIGNCQLRLSSTTTDARPFFESEKNSVCERAAADMQRARKLSPDILAYQDGAAIKDDPSNPRSWARRATSHYANKNYGQALADADQAIELDPNLADAHLTRAGAQLGLGQPKEALWTLEKALALGCDRERAFQLRAAIFTKAKNYDKALEAISQAIEMRRDNSYNYMRRSNIYFEKCDLDNAIADAEEVIRLKPGDPAGYVQRGYLYSQKGDYDTALQDFDKALAIDPKNARAMENRGEMLFRKGDLDAGYRLIMKALKLDPAMADAYVDLAEICLLKGDRAGALKQLDKAREKDPSDRVRDAIEKMLRRINGL